MVYHRRKFDCECTPDNVCLLPRVEIEQGALKFLAVASHSTHDHCDAFRMASPSYSESLKAASVICHKFDRFRKFLESHS